MDEMKKAIDEAQIIIITAGAGMGVDSGLPDFRGNEGFWKAYPPLKKYGYSFSDMANPKWFDKDPHLAWAFYGHRLNLYRNTIPHDGFALLKRYVQDKEYFIFTSNVDGQFQKAGFDDDRICEVHGSIHHVQCQCNQEIISASDIHVDVDMDAFKANNLPKCKQCGRVLRPNILMFNDWGWNNARTNAQEDRLYRFVQSIDDKKTVVIEIGAGETIPTVRDFSELLQSRFGATLIRINPRNYDVPQPNGFIIPNGGLEGLRILFT